MIWQTLKPTYPLLQQPASSWFITQTRQSWLEGRPSESTRTFPNTTLEAVSPERAALVGGHGGCGTSYRTRTGNLPPVWCLVVPTAIKYANEKGRLADTGWLCPLLSLVCFLRGMAGAPRPSWHCRLCYTCIIYSIYLDFILFLIFSFCQIHNVRTMKSCETISVILGYKTKPDSQLGSQKVSQSGRRSNHLHYVNYEPSKSTKNILLPDLGFVVLLLAVK